MKRDYCHEVNDEELRADVRRRCYDRCYAIAKTGSADKHWRQDSFDAICDEYIESLPEEEREAKAPLVKRYYHDVEKEAMRRCVLNEGMRLNGRKTTEIRPIWCEVDYLPGPHGSAIFTRGETQSLSTVTLGTKLEREDSRRRAQPGPRALPPPLQLPSLLHRRSQARARRRPS